MIRNKTKILILISILTVFQAACATRMVERTVFERKGVTAHLRKPANIDETAGRGFQHPVEISDARLSRILAAISVRIEQDGEMIERPIFEARMLPRISRALGKGLAEADSEEEVALNAVLRSRWLGIFTEKSLTNFVAYAKDGLLTISLSRIDWDLDKGQQSRATRDRLPRPKLGDDVMEFRVVQSPDFEASGRQVVAVRWSDPRWDAPEAKKRSEANPAVGSEATATEGPAPDAQSDAAAREGAEEDSEGEGVPASEPGSEAGADAKTTPEPPAPDSPVD